jgi:protein TonB
MLDALALLLLQAAPAAADYPFRALREGREGVTEFDVRTDSAGRVMQCWIVKSSGSPDLDDATCRRATRQMRVTPPLNEHGQPQPATWKSKMEWKIGGSGSPPAPR